MAKARLESLEDLHCRIDKLLRVVEQVPGVDSCAGESGAGALEEARKALKAEQERARLFGPDIFPNPGWAILLQLFVSGAEGRHVTSAGLCAAACVPETIALRHLAVLVSAKLVRRQPQGDTHEGLLKLTPGGEQSLRDYFGRAPGARMPLPHEFDGRAEMRAGMRG